MKIKTALAVALVASTLGACHGNFYPPGDPRVIGSVPPICTFFGYQKFDENADPSCKAPEGAKRDGNLWVVKSN